MQFAAVLVEYFVTGCGNLICIGLLAGVNPQQLTGLPTEQIGYLVLPLVYVLGMFTDATMSIVLRPLKRIVRKDADSDPLARRQASLAWLMMSSSELGREFQSRSSRDRIARGAVFNIAVFGVIAVWSPERLAAMLGVSVPARAWVGLFAVLSTALAFSLWWHFEYYTHKFKVQALEAIARQRGA